MKEQDRFIEVFTTTVTSHQKALAISACLISALEGARVSFDLDDVDCVLRIASPHPINNEWIVHVVETFGFEAAVMPDVVAEAVTGA
jgi:hypothetical protein